MSALHQTIIIVVDADPIANTANKKASYANYIKIYAGVIQQT